MEEISQLYLSMKILKKSKLIESIGEDLIRKLIFSLIKFLWCFLPLCLDYPYLRTNLRCILIHKEFGEIY